MKPSIKYYVLMAFCCGMLAQVSCGEQPMKVKVDQPVWESVSFPVMTWFGIREEHLDLRHMQDLAAAGFTINFSHFSNQELNLKALDLAQEAGVKLVIADSRIQPDKPVDDEALAKIDEVVAAYKNHPALFGYHVRDEPNAAIFANMAKIKERILSQDSYHLVYGNLFPNYANEKQLGTPTYEEHVDMWMKVFQPQVLSYDHYPFTNKGFREQYYENLGIIRDAALAAGVPFWAFTMSCEIDPAYPAPNEQWIRLQLYSDLAYGAEGLQYFTYGLPNSGGEKFTVAILDKDGEKTYLYDIAKKVNAEIHAIAPVYKTLHSMDVFHTAPLPNGAEALPSDFFLSEVSGGPMLIGYFQDSDQNDFLLLVNRDFEKTVGFSLSIGGNISSLVECSKTGGGMESGYESKDGKITLDFSPGDGRLFRVER